MTAREQKRRLRIAVLATAIAGLLAYMAGLAAWSHYHGGLRLLWVYYAMTDEQRIRYLEKCTDSQVQACVMADSTLSPAVRRVAARRGLMGGEDPQLRAAAATIVADVTPKRREAIETLVAALRQEKDGVVIVSIHAELLLLTWRADMIVAAASAENGQDMARPWITWWQTSEAMPYEAILHESVDVALRGLDSSNEALAQASAFSLRQLLGRHISVPERARLDEADIQRIGRWWRDNKATVILALEDQ